MRSLYHPALAGTPPEEGNWNHLGRLFQTRLYHGSAELAERPASMQAYIPVGGPAGMTTEEAFRLSRNLNPCHADIAAGLWQRRAGRVLSAFAQHPGNTSGFRPAPE